VTSGVAAACAAGLSISFQEMPPTTARAITLSETWRFRQRDKGVAERISASMGVWMFMIGSGGALSDFEAAG
jgi:hypothetical protein